MGWSTNPGAQGMEVPTGARTLAGKYPQGEIRREREALSKELLGQLGQELLERIRLATCPR
jgi:hypothetical protein